MSKETKRSTLGRAFLRRAFLEQAFLGRAFFLILSLLIFSHTASAQKASHGFSIYGDLAYPKGFTHFSYVNPNAPKGGKVNLGSAGGFDNFNPFSIKGRIAAGTGLLYDTLTTSATDDPFSVYGLIAEALTLSKDRRQLTYRLKQHARFNDGTPISVEDVLFTYEAARSPFGPPLYRQYYADIVKIEKTGPRDVTFFLSNGDNREIPLIIGQLPILPRHFWKDRDITKTSLDIPIGSGPYRISNFETNRFVEYKRNPDYWGKNEPTQTGFNNFDTIRYDYYRDSNVIIEALKSGDIDFRAENSSKAWATSYDIKAVERGNLIKARIPHKRVIGMQGYVFNQRKPIFKDREVRKAIAYAFDFEWANETLFYGQYARSRSYFGNSKFEAKAVLSGKSLALLEKWRDTLPEETFHSVYHPPNSQGTALGFRNNLKEASAILKKAGWEIKKGQRVSVKDGTSLSFEIMLFDPLQERIALPFAQNLKKLGVKATIRTVDAAQYVQRLENFEFDMVVASWGQSRNPGNEQLDMWSSAAASTPGSSNLSGISHPAIDAVIEDIISVKTRDNLHDAVRALDTALQWQYLVVPHFQTDYDRILHWNRFGMPGKVPDTGVSFTTWWINPALTLNQSREE